MFLGAFIILALLIVGFNAWKGGIIQRSLQSAVAENFVVIESNVYRDGEVICLSHSDTLECEFGFLTADGERYGLRDVRRAGPEGTIQPGDKLRIMGDIVQPKRRRGARVTADLKVERVQDLQN